ncbi:MAG: DinB family protein [Planctomycetes bacterium]|nr:DinB family protein [Planctomycetota bacterium]
MSAKDWDEFVEKFRSTLRRAAEELRKLPERDAGSRPAPGKWSKKEIVGHLIDSASNNHQRFLRARLQASLVFPGYDQDEWVRVEEWQAVPWNELVELWLLYNLQLAHLMLSTPEPERTRLRSEHNLHELAFREHAADTPATLEWFQRDYVLHLEHHLVQAGLERVLRR